MPRFRRSRSPGALVHIIGRFVDREFRVRTPRERAEYLRRIPDALAAADWSLFGYVVMSSHVHLVALAGCAPSADWVKPLHVGFARWLNNQQGRFGPVFAERHSTIVCAPARAGRLLAYLHNNPVRAGVVADASESDWSSHGAYWGDRAAPRWLKVEVGLSLCGFDATPSGRAGFDAFVAGQRGTSAMELSDEGLTAARAKVRRAVGAPIEIGGFEATEHGRVAQVYARHGTPIRPRWDGDPLDVLRLVADAAGLTPERIQSKDRQRRVVEARRLALEVWTRHLGRQQVSMAVVLGISQPAASMLRAGAAFRGEEVELGRAVWTRFPGTCEPET